MKKELKILTNKYYFSKTEKPTNQKLPRMDFLKLNTKGDEMGIECFTYFTKMYFKFPLLFVWLSNKYCCQFILLRRCFKTNIITLTIMNDSGSHCLSLLR